MNLSGLALYYYADVLRGLIDSQKVVIEYY